MLTCKEIFELKDNGQIEEAYDAARALYAVDRSPYACSAMFWTAVSMFRVRVFEGRTVECEKILKALERLLPSVPDPNGRVADAYKHSVQQMRKANGRSDLLQNGPHHLSEGVWGEELAAAYLRDKGYVILERDWHSGHRDIDIIARHGRCVVFVEVKTRRSTDYGTPEEAIDWKKRRHLRSAISHYVKYYRVDIPFRFDIVSIVGEMGGSAPRIEHLEDVDISR